MAGARIRAICFDLDNTLWDVEPVLERAERILAEWLAGRYPQLVRRFTPEEYAAVRAALLAEQPEQAHDLTFLRRESIARIAAAEGLDRAVAQQIFERWHAARNQVEPFADVGQALERLKPHFRLATLTNGNADLARIGLAHHFEVMLAAEHIGCAKPDARAYTRLTDALTLPPEEILFVGDDPHADVLGPRAAGMRTAWMNRRRTIWPGDLAPADHVIADLEELVALLTVKYVNCAR